jgi:hypothetical protein
MVRFKVVVSKHPVGVRDVEVYVPEEVYVVVFSAQVYESHAVAL